MNKPGIHRVVAGTKAARQHIAKASKIVTPRPSLQDAEIRAHNDRVEAERRLKKHAKAHGMKVVDGQLVAPETAGMHLIGD